MKGKEINRVLKNTKEFSEWGQVDFFQWDEQFFYEYYKKGWVKLQALFDRIMFYYNTQPDLLPWDDMKKWFAYFSQVLFDKLEENLQTIEDKDILKDKPEE